MIEMGNAVIIMLISVMGGFIQRVSGFGFGIFVMLFLPHIMSVHTEAAAISTLISCAMTTYNAVVYRKSIPFWKIIPLIVGALIMIPVAVHFSVLISGDFFKKLLGIVLILLSIYFLFFNNRIKIKPTVKNGFIAGGIGGILSGLFSTGGPPVVLYLMNAMTDNAVYFASTQFYFSLTGLYSTVVRAFSGIITPGVLLYAAIGYIGCTAGNFVGKYVFNRLNAQRLKEIVYFGMIICGIIMIV